MEPLYKPQGVEERWQRTWEDEGHNAADAEAPGEPFVIAHPPPNVTGELHMGHALQLALADALVRMKRMQGYNTLFQPGYDHAGISTQAAVEKALEGEGRTRQDLGREAFEAYVWDWLRRYGRPIMNQFRAIGASLDYRLERFTLSDLELDHVEVDDTLLTIRYPFADGDGGIAIATVRPATILADVAVAVHPDDDRYRDLVGKEVVVPYVERTVPIVSDERVEMEFGTGALKVTPGHDPTDFEIGRVHDLP